MYPVYYDCTAHVDPVCYYEYYCLFKMQRFVCFETDADDMCTYICIHFYGQGPQNRIFQRHHNIYISHTHTHTHSRARARTHTHTGIHLTPAADATCTPREAIAEFVGGGQPVLLDDSLSINLLARVTSSALKEIQHGTQFTCFTSTKVQILT